jgi:type VI secretion system protein ImpM
MPDAPDCGWFGKLPALGDFGSRRLPPPMLARCDAWLSAGLASSRARLGERWLGLYLGAPLWHFLWSPGVVDPQWWRGVLMPSVDRVGRYFPLLLAAGWSDGPPDDPAGLQRWLDALAEAGRDCLRPGASVERLEAALQALPPRPAAATAEALPRRLVEQAVPNGHSLWWSPDETPRPDAQAPLAAPVAGLPQDADFDALLDGRD